MISPKVLKLDSDEKRNLHDMLIHGRNKFYAHVDAETEYFDHKDVPVDRLLKLLVNVKDMQDGTAELDAGVTEPQLTLETVPRIKALCEELLKALNVEKKDLLKCLVEAGYKLKIGQNVLTLE